MAARPSLLVAEDDAGIADLVAEVLADEGYHVVVAATAAQAAALLAARRFDLVLANTLLATPVADPAGRWVTLEWLRALAAPAPVIIFTAYPAGLFADYQARGFRALLAKPFRLEELSAVIRRALAGEAG